MDGEFAEMPNVEDVTTNVFFLREQKNKTCIISAVISLSGCKMRLEDD